jgi:hypothetical protein
MIVADVREHLKLRVKTNMKVLRIALICLALPTLVFAQTAKILLEEKRLLDEKLLVSIPQSFGPMSEEMLRLKYPSERRPTLVFTNQSGSVNVAINHTANRITLEQLPELKNQMETMFKNLYPSATWFRNEMVEINGRRYFLLDLRTPAVDTEVRNIMAGTSLEDRFLIITFNATKALETTWIPIGNQIIQSVKIVK